MLTEGLTHTSIVTVTDENTAQTLGSGDMPVFATPALVSLIENAAMLAVSPQMPDGFTTVGGFIEVTHLAPSPIGANVSATAILTQIKGRKLTFTIEAFEGEKVVGKATHVRFIVESERFLSTL